jgi:hypothetical protein
VFWCAGHPLPVMLHEVYLAAPNHESQTFKIVVVVVVVLC